MQTESTSRCFGGTQGFYTHDSACGPMRFAVYQPPQAADRPVPVVTFLSGLTCTADNVVTKGGFQRVAADRLELMMQAVADWSQGFIRDSWPGSSMRSETSSS